MVLNIYTAKSIAELLLQIKAIKLDTKNHFTWASGWHSPIYCDNRILLSHPSARRFVAEKMANRIQKYFSDVDVIAAVATGAIGMGMLVAHLLELPMIYVRPEQKNHGKQNQIEGQYIKGQKIVVIEDLISTGKSSLNAVRALRKEDLQVLGMMAIFSYEFEIAHLHFKQEKLPLYTLSNYPELLQKAVENGDISNQEKNTLLQWRLSPETYKR